MVSATASLVTSKHPTDPAGLIAREPQSSVGDTARLGAEAPAESDGGHHDTHPTEETQSAEALFQTGDPVGEAGIGHRSPEKKGPLEANRHPTESESGSVPRPEGGYLLVQFDHPFPSSDRPNGRLSLLH